MSAKGRRDRKTLLYVAVLCTLLFVSSFIIGSYVAMKRPSGSFQAPPNAALGVVAVLAFVLKPLAPQSLILYAIAVLGFIHFKSWRVRKGIGRKSIPARDLDLQEMLNRVAKEAGVRNIEPIVIDSSFPNAFVFKKGQKHLVAVTIPLLEMLDTDELESVLAHEVAHIRNRDRRVRIFGLIIGSHYFYLPFVLLLVKAIFRRREYLADETGAVLKGTPKPLISTLLKISEYMKSFSGSMDSYPSSISFSFISPAKRGLRKLLSSSPTIEDRIGNLMKLPL